MPTTANITISEVERIAALSDAVLRNLQITQCYHELALVLAERTGCNANWCTFATWASKQAGQTIRKEDLGRMLEARLGSEAAAAMVAQNLQAAAQRLGVQLESREMLALIWKAYDPPSAFERSSAAVARGNLKVFAEIGREFARFYAECLADPVFDAAKLNRFIEQLRPGDPPDGQRFLRQAFTHYYQALFTEDEKARVELLLLANLEIGYHEQARLQPEIVDALTAPVLSPQVFAQNLLKALFPDSSWFTEIIWVFLRWFGRLADFDHAIEAFVAIAQREAQFIVTQTMMAIELSPNHRLQLGDDLAAGFPPLLQQISNAELLALLAQIDPTPDSTRLSGTDFWGELPDRLHFIADMFRCYEMSAALLEPPFSPDQTAALKEGCLPEGRL